MQQEFQDRNTQEVDCSRLDIDIQGSDPSVDFTTSKLSYARKVWFSCEMVGQMSNQVHGVVERLGGHDCGGRRLKASRVCAE